MERQQPRSPRKSLHFSSDQWSEEFCFNYINKRKKMNPVLKNDMAGKASSERAIPFSSNRMNFGGLKVLMISSDRNIFTPGSAVATRMEEYGSLVEELHIVILSNKEHGLKEKKLGENVWLYPTDSSSKYKRSMDAARIGKKVVLKNKFVRGLSLVTAQDPFECGWAGFKVKNKWRIPLEIQLHTDPFSPYFSGFQNVVRKILSKRILKRADSVRAVNESLKTKLSLLTKASISVLPIYIDRSRFEGRDVSFDVHARYPWHFILLCVARLEPEKNVSLALEILALVRKSYPDTGLLIAGSGSEEAKIKALANKLELEGAVEFVGWQEDLYSFYKTSNVFIQTSLFEGYGLALVEAGLLELPVVTTPVGLALELEPGKDALIYPATAPELFAAGIIDLIENNQKGENLKFNLKKTLDAKLISKDDYLLKLKESWEEVSKRIK